MRRPDGSAAVARRGLAAARRDDGLRRNGRNGGTLQWESDGRDWPNRKFSRFEYAAGLRWHVQDIGEGSPLLLVHGGNDDNTGTYPIQSERLYGAMKGLGGTVRWVELPLEGHGYESREAVGHVLWEMDRWLNQYIGDAATPIATQKEISP